MNKIICSDVIDGLKTIPDESVSLVFTSPPYNTNINYSSNDDNLVYQDYLDWLKKVWVECERVLRVGGRLVINIDSVRNTQEDNDKEYVRNIYADLVIQMREIDDLNFRTEINWFKHQVVGRATAWGSYCSCSNPTMRRNHEYLICWSKKEWSLPGNSDMSDMLPEEFQKFTMSTWFITPETKNLGNHPCPFPEQLAYRVIKLYSYRDDVVLDPFNGIGTTTAVAASLGRRYVGIDLDKEYCDFARKRTDEEEQQLKQFPVNIPTLAERIKKSQEDKGSSEPAIIEDMLENEY